MIIDDSVNFFGVYHHNCIFNLGLSDSFKDLYEKHKYLNVILCQKDDKGGYLMTQNITSKENKNPNMQSYYDRNKEELKEGFKKISNRIESTEKTFYLLRSNNNYDIDDTQQIVTRWKQEVKNAIKEA